MPRIWLAWGESRPSCLPTLFGENLGGSRHLSNRSPFSDGFPVRVWHISAPLLVRTGLIQHISYVGFCDRKKKKKGIESSEVTSAGCVLLTFDFSFWAKVTKTGE